MAELGTAIPDFSLPNTNPTSGGAVVSMSDFEHDKALLVVFICNHCPYVLHIMDKLVEVAREFQPKGAATVAISVNDVDTYPQDAPDKMTEIAVKYGFSFPYLFDESQQSARDFGAVCTPDFFLYGPERKLAYRGQFDGSRPGNQLAVNGADIIHAIESVLDDSTMVSEQLPSVGCSIKWKPGGAP